jgi:hypothetical protein
LNYSTASSRDAGHEPLQVLSLGAAAALKGLAPSSTRSQRRLVGGANSMNRRMLLLFFCVLFSETPPLSMGAQKAQDQTPSQVASPTVETQTSSDTKWLFSYDGQPAGQLVSDKRFEPLLRKYFPNTIVKFWSTQTQVKRVPDVALEFLSGPPEKVLIERNRYVTATGCIPRFCEDRGLLWLDTRVDTDTPQPTLVFMAIDVRSSSTHLWLFSNKDFYDNPFTIPQDLRLNVTRWLAIRKPEPVKRIDEASIVDPAGQSELDVAPAVLGVPISLNHLRNP